MYNYYEAVKEDVKEYINNEIDLNEWNEDREDSVTGNGSGSYTFSRWQAEENLSHNLDLLAEALEEFGENESYLFKRGAEWADVTIRCYLLSSTIAEVLNELEINGAFDNETIHN